VNTGINVVLKKDLFYFNQSDPGKKLFGGGEGFKIWLNLIIPELDPDHYV
jgi:hypothetical protein